MADIEADTDKAVIIYIFWPLINKWLIYKIVYI